MKKAQKNDVVIHKGKLWTVLDRKYDPSWGRQSFYLLRNDRGQSWPRSPTKWARSDTFTVITLAQ